MAIKLSKDEIALLKLGPKFCILKDLSEEVFEREIEESIVKLRWEKMAEDKKDKENKKFGVDTLDAINTIFEEEELEEHEEEMEMEEAKSRMTYHGDKRSLNMARRKVREIPGSSSQRGWEIWTLNPD